MPQATKKKKSPAPSTADNPVLDLAGAARFLRLPVKTIERLVVEQGLPGRQIGKEWRFLRAAIERWLEPGRKPNAAVRDQFGALLNDPTYDDYRRILEENRRRFDQEVA